MQKVDINYYFAGFYAQSVWRRPVSELITGVAREGQSISPELYLAQNYPNPFNLMTTISYVIPKNGNVKVIVYNLLGRQLNVVVNSMQTKGYHEILFDASNLASGLYIYKLEFENTTLTRKMLLLK